jgi:hypothetical protein
MRMTLSLRLVRMEENNKNLSATMAILPQLTDMDLRILPIQRCRTLHLPLCDTIVSRYEQFRRMPGDNFIFFGDKFFIEMLTLRKVIHIVRCLTYTWLPRAQVLHSIPIGPREALMAQEMMVVVSNIDVSVR